MENIEKVVPTNYSNGRDVCIRIEPSGVSISWIDDVGKREPIVIFQTDLTPDVEEYGDIVKLIVARDVIEMYLQKNEEMMKMLSDSLIQAEA